MRENYGCDKCGQIFDYNISAKVKICPYCGDRWIYNEFTEREKINFALKKLKLSERQLIELMEDSFKLTKEEIDPIATNDYEEYSKHSDDLLKLRELNKKKNRT